MKLTHLKESFIDGNYDEKLKIVSFIESLNKALVPLGLIKRDEVESKKITSRMEKFKALQSNIDRNKESKDFTEALKKDKERNPSKSMESISQTLLNKKKMNILNELVKNEKTFEEYIKYYKEVSVIIDDTQKILDENRNLMAHFTPQNINKMMKNK